MPICVQDLKREGNIIMFSGKTVVFDNDIQAKDSLDEFLDWYNDMYHTSYEQCEDGDASYIKERIE